MLEELRPEVSRILQCMVAAKHRAGLRVVDLILCKRDQALDEKVDCRYTRASCDASG